METYLCIIGFAISGIPVARWAKEAGLDFVVFEKSSTFGGVWIHKSYDNILLQTTKYSYSYSDFPMGDHVSLHPTRDEILSYLGTYIHHHGLSEWVRYNQEVVMIEPLDKLPSNPSIPGYRLLIKNLVTGSAYTITCQKIAVCSGIYTTPKIPTSIRTSKFSGTVAHSELFALGRSHSSYNFTDQHVTVVGNGPTGCDLAVNAYDGGAKSVTILYRSPRWLFTRYLGTVGLNFFSNRFFLWVGINLPVNMFIALLYLVFYLPYYVFGFRKGLELPTTIVNRHNLTMNEKLLRYINTDRITYTRATQIQCTGHQVTYLSNKVEKQHNADLVILATGYENEVPFLAPQKLPPLYKRILLPDQDSIGFIGFAPSFNWCQVSDLQARWFIKLITNRITVPDRNARLKFMKQEGVRYRKLQYEYNDLAYQAYHYCDELARDLGITPTSRYSLFRWCSVPKYDEWYGF